VDTVRLAAKVLKQYFVSFPRQISNDQSADDPLSDVGFVGDVEVPEKHRIGLAVRTHELVLQNGVRTVVHQVVDTIDAQPECAKLGDKTHLVLDAALTQLSTLGLHLSKARLIDGITLSQLYVLGGRHGPFTNAHRRRRFPEQAAEEGKRRQCEA
jgi:hypothetical protein